MNDLSEIDIIYSPSRWSRRMSGNVIVQKHIEFLQKKSQDTRNNIPCTLDVPYGSGQREKYDIFGTDLKNDAPVFMFVHGGYWQEPIITHSIQSCVVENLYKNGIKSICIGYELCPKVSVEEIIKNIQIAIAQCFKYAKESQPRSIYFAGHSAGADLVLWIFKDYISALPTADQKLIKGVFLLAGLYNLVPLVDTMYNIPLKLDETTAKNVSIYHQNIKPTGKTMIYVITVEHDSPAFKKLAKQMFDRLQELGVPSTFKMFQNLDHFDMIEKFTESDSELVNFIVSVINSD